MDLKSFKLNVISAATAKRNLNKSKRITQKFVHDSLNQRNKQRYEAPRKPKADFATPVNLPVRMISSGAVYRNDNSQVVKADDIQPPPEIVAIDKGESLFYDLMKKGNNFRLRTPYVRRRPKTSSENQSHKSVRMTRNCAQHFQQIMQDYKPEVQQCVDPSYSVRKIVRKSGLLKTFGNGHLLENDGIDYSKSDVFEESSCISEIPKADASLHGQTSSPRAEKRNGLEVILLGDEKNEFNRSENLHNFKLSNEVILSPQNAANIKMEDTEISSFSSSSRKTFIEEFEKNIQHINNDFMPSKLQSNEITDQMNRNDDDCSIENYPKSPYQVENGLQGYNWDQETCNVFNGFIVEETYEMEMIKYLTPSPNTSLGRNPPTTSPSTSSDRSSDSAGRLWNNEEEKVQNNTHLQEDVVGCDQDSVSGSGYEPSSEENSDADIYSI